MSSDQPEPDPAALVETVLIDTPRGPARAHLSRAARSRGLVMLGHGAGGGVDAPDLLLARDVALASGLSVALVEQPYRVAGRRAPAPAAHVDEAWLTVAADLSGRAPGTLITGGRSFGGRVACRTALAARADAVLCLAFPVRPPGEPEPSRQPELSGVGVPALVVQGEQDPFGIPEGSETTEVVVVQGDHSLRKDHDAIAAVLDRWLQRIVAPPDGSMR